VKTVSRTFAFRKLNQWRLGNWPITFGTIKDVDIRGRVRKIFSGDSTQVVSADKGTGDVTLLGEAVITLAGASFRFSDFEDSPLNQAELGPEEFESYLEATLPDGRVVLFAREWKHTN